MIEKTRGVFLHAVKYSETSLIACIYTEALGRQSFVVNGLHGKGTSLRAAVFQPLYLLDVEFYYRPGKEISRMKNAKISSPYLTIPFDIRKSTQVLFLAEVLYKCLREEGADPALFEFLFQALEILDLAEAGVSNFHLWFLFRLTRFLGIYPEQDQAPVSNFFDLQSGSFVSREPDHLHFANKQETQLLVRLFEIDSASLHRLEFTQKERRLVLQKLVEFYQIHFDNLGTIRSLEVLKEVLR